MKLDEVFESVRHTTNPSCPVCTPIDGYTGIAGFVITGVNQVNVMDVEFDYE